MRNSSNYAKAETSFDLIWFKDRNSVPGSSKAAKIDFIIIRYLYNIEFRPTEEYSNVDAVSRLPLHVNQVSLMDHDDAFID